MSAQAFARSSFASLAVLVLGVAPGEAQITPIGLSEVGGQWFALEAPSAVGNDQFGGALAAGDFNGDGADDLATGVPGGRDPLVCPGSSCGFVLVRYGAPGNRLGAGPAPTILREEPGAALPVEFFGSALAAGDFDGDTFTDLAVGIPTNAPNQQGAVQVYYGASGGLQTAGAHFLSELAAGEPEHICNGARFGTALAAGNFDGDAYADLAIGAPRGCERVGQQLIDGGSVFVLHGSDTGLLPFLGYRISQDSIFIFEEVESGDRFAAALAAGDFDADGFDDVAIGVPQEGDHGALEIIMGSEFGLIFADSAYWAPGALGEIPELGDRLGAALAAADFDGDGHDDLAIGDPSEDLGPANEIVDAGSAAIAYGSPTGFDLARTDHLTQSLLYGPVQEGELDAFGGSFTAGDFDSDGHGDLAIGHPADSWSGFAHGAVSIVLGAPAGLGSSTRFRFLATGWDGLPGDATQTTQRCGWSLAAGDFDGNGFSDLAIGVPLYDGVLANSGGEAVLYGALFADGFGLGAADRWSSVQN